MDSEGFIEVLAAVAFTALLAMAAVAIGTGFILLCIHIASTGALGLICSMFLFEAAFAFCIMQRIRIREARDA